MLKNLLWKEYRQNQWKLVFCLTVSMAFTYLPGPDTGNDNNQLPHYFYNYYQCPEQ
jgi:hypothetical protein